MRFLVVSILAAMVALSCTSPAPVAVTAAPSFTAAPTASASPLPTRTPGPSAVPAVAITQISAIQRLDARVGWIAANPVNPVLLRTTDGGATWQSLPTLGALFTKLQFVDVRAGWAIATTPPTCRAVGANPCTTAIFVTADGGDHWNEVFRAADDLARGPAIVDLAATDAQHAWVILRTDRCDPEGCAHQVYGSDDAGAHWRVLREPFIATAIARASVNTGWLIGSGAPANTTPIIGTSDAGATWRQQYQNTLQSVALTAHGDRAAWALFRDGSFCTSSSCAKYDLVRSTDGATWTSVGNPFANATPAGCGGFLERISFGDEKTGWITVNLGAGPLPGTGGVLRTNDGGSTWTCQTSPANTALVSAANAQNVWVTSSDRTSNRDTLWGSDDGGRTWSQMPISVR